MDIKRVGYECVDWINLAWDKDQWQIPVKPNEPSSSVKITEFLDQLYSPQLLKMKSAPWSQL
jgi:hypothetical protein